MKNASLFSSKIFTLSLSLSMVLCSASLLVFSVGHMPQVKAEVESSAPALHTPAPWDANLRGAVGLGIVKDTAYFVVFANPNLLYKAGLRNAQDWYK